MASIRSKLLIKILWLMKLRGQFRRTMESGSDRLGRDFPSKLFLNGINVSYYTYGEKKHLVLESKRYKSNKSVIFIHGGLFVCKSNAYHWDFITDFVKRTGSKVYCLDYPLAPTLHSGQAFDYVKSFYMEIINSEKNLYLLGDSAGGGLVLSLLIALKKDKVMMPRKAFLISPLIDMKASQDMESKDHLDPIISYDDFLTATRAYMGSLDSSDWRVSPLKEELSDLCRLCIYTSDLDILHGQAQMLKEKLSHCNTSYTYYFEPDMPHDWGLFRLIPEAIKVRKVIAEEILKD